MVTGLVHSEPFDLPLWGLLIPSHTESMDLGRSWRQLWSNTPTWVQICWFDFLPSQNASAGNQPNETRIGSSRVTFWEAFIFPARAVKRLDCCIVVAQYSTDGTWVEGVSLIETTVYIHIPKSTYWHSKDCIVFVFILAELVSTDCTQACLSWYSEPHSL